MARHIAICRTTHRVGTRTSRGPRRNVRVIRSDHGRGSQRPRRVAGARHRARRSPPGAWPADRVSTFVRRSPAKPRRILGGRRVQQAVAGTAYARPARDGRCTRACTQGMRAVAGTGRHPRGPFEAARPLRDGREMRGSAARETTVARRLADDKGQLRSPASVRGERVTTACIIPTSAFPARHDRSCVHTSRTDQMTVKSVQSTP